jgi:hypothetical protein
MRSVACMGNCMFASLRQLIGEHFSMILAAGVVGALFGLAYAGGAGGLAGAGVGIVLATVYGYIPRITDCVGACPID